MHPELPRMWAYLLIYIASIVSPPFATNISSHNTQYIQYSAKRLVKPTTLRNLGKTPFGAASSTYVSFGMAMLQQEANIMTYVGTRQYQKQ